MLTSRWYPLKPHDEQFAAYTAKERFVVIPAPRRTGKSELAKRRLVEKALAVNPRLISDAHFIASAPTHQQARRIFWDHLRELSPRQYVKSISISDRSIRFHNNAEIIVCGMDAPERIEGIPLDGCVLDELANMRENVWMDHIYPALGTPGRPPGWAWLIGVPEGRNHYWRMWKRALDPRETDWAAFRWSAKGIVSPEILAAAKRDMDDRSYRQEWEGAFVDFAGRVYYAFDRELHASERVAYDPGLPLIFCFDFNVAPGTATIMQEQAYTGSRLQVAKNVTAVIGEVWIPDNSNTPIVCRRLLQDWGEHKGDVVCYGDASGGARTTCQTDGNDWDLIQQYLAPVFGDRLDVLVPRANPLVKNRVNAMNTRILSADRLVRFLVDPSCQHVIEDFEGVKILTGSAGEIDKKSDPELTHLSDGIGYYMHQEYPVYEERRAVTSGVW